MNGPVAEAVAAAINAGKPIATHNEGWSRGAIGIWAGVCTIVPILLTAMVKLLPVMKKLANDRENSIDEERRADMATMRLEFAETKREAREANARSSRLESMLSCLRPAITILMAEVERLDPESGKNTALKQARELMGMAAAGDGGIALALARITENEALRRT